MAITCFLTLAHAQDSQQQDNLRDTTQVALQESMVWEGREIAPSTSQSWMQAVYNTKMPITVIRGKHTGPVLTLIAGVHGDEFPAIFALQQIKQTIVPESLHGTLILIHLANLEGFHGRRIAVSPADQKNLNRVFPGKANGTLTEQVAYFITQQVIAKTDYLIDIHSGSWNQTLLPHVYSPVMTRPNQDKSSFDKKTLDFAKALGIAHIVLYDERPIDPENAISLPNTAQTRGKLGLTLEVGNLGQSNATDITLIKQSCLNAMRYLKMLSESANPPSHSVTFRKIISVNSAETGLFHPQLKVGAQVSKGQMLGWVSDYFGHIVSHVHAPVTGTVLIQKGTPPILRGESVVEIGVP